MHFPWKHLAGALVLLPMVAIAVDPRPDDDRTPAVAAPEKFPDPVNTEADVNSKALPPEEAARGFQVPEGFHVNVAAAEPDVQNPIAMAWDSRGRLWVAENYTYADRFKKFDLGHRDRVLILEDTDHDGRFDKRTVFTDDVQMLTGIAIGYGGVWLMTPPQLIYIPNHDDKPEGSPIVMLDGFTPATDNHHTFANGLKWGPDGWLYGRCGASSPGRVGVPGTPDEKRVPLFGGIWRFRPDLSRLTQGNAVSESISSPRHKHVAQEGGLLSPLPPRQSPVRLAPLFEVLCHGTTNPWGMDWNEHGEAFFINTVNGHLWHMIPGAHFRRPHSEDPNPYVYETIDTHADHYHWDTGKDWTDSRKVTGEHGRLGGGHAHSGMTIYLGDNWPESYRGKLLTLNLHGRRVNVDKLEREGSGYVGRHEPDMLQSADPWFRGIELSYGPDGAIYILDWSDTGECHEHTGVHRTSGRIYRVTYGSKPIDREELIRNLSYLSLKDRTKRELAVGVMSLHQHPNEWFARQARQVLVKQSDPWLNSNRSAVLSALSAFFDESDIQVKLRAHLTMFVLGDEVLLNGLLHHDNEHVRTWAIRLLTDAWPIDTIMGDRHPQAIETVSDELFAKLLALAEDESGLVRLALASTLQRLPLDRRLELAARLSKREADADDHNLPLMIWYGVMPLAKSQPETLARFAAECEFPITRQLIARRLAESIDEHPRAIEELLAIDGSAARADILKGLAKGLTGRHKAKAPANWAKVQEQIESQDDESLRNLVRDLSVLFGDGRALAEVQRVALDGKADLAARRAALQTLIDNRAPERRKICEQLLSVRYLNTTAIRGLTEFDDAAIGEKLAKSYRSFFPSERPAVIDALVTRPAFAIPLLNEIAAGKIPKDALTVLHARQIRSFANEQVTQRLNEVWGELRDTPEDRQQLIAKWKSQLTPESLGRADLGEGRAVFAKICANCHRLYGHGAQIGPDLTGSGRQNLDYVLINLIDPSAAVGTDYRMSIVVMKDGRVLNGIVASKSDKVLTLQMAKERLTIEQSEIDEVQPSTQSLMPDGQLQTLTEDQVRDLVAYLMSPTQVPLKSEVPASQ